MTQMVLRLNFTPSSHLPFDSFYSFVAAAAMRGSSRQEMKIRGFFPAIIHAARQGRGGIG
jgi:hypothetical protein